MDRPVTVRLIGGLGNQLFGYYAGAALAAHRGVGLRLDTSWTRHGMTDHGIEILRFDLPGDWTSRGPGLRSARRRGPLSPGGAAGRAVDKLLPRLPALSRLFRVHYCPGVGHDPTLLAQPAGTELRGYFQSWATVDAAVRAGYPRRPTLRSSSAWIVDAVRTAARDRPICVHVRRGDYMTIPGLGLLGPDYYEAAISKLREHGLNGPLWLFSDDLDNARVALGRFGEQAVLMSSPSSAAEEMIAMSHASGHVIANSTFSWWGAWMNDPEVPVIAPDPWFVEGPKIPGLLPPDWSTIRR